jgi:nitrogen fixation NifU-like protein
MSDPDPDAPSGAPPDFSRYEDHWRRPRNVGELPDPDAAADVANPVCGDLARLHLRVRDGVIAQAVFKVRGCPAAIAAMSAVTEMVRGKTPSAAARLTAADVTAFLGALPSRKQHAAVLAEDAVRAAVEDFSRRNGTR